MKILFTLLLTIGVSAAANATTMVNCNSDSLNVTVTEMDGKYEATVLQLMRDEWATIYTAAVNRTTTRASNLLFIGENFGLGVVTDTASSNNLFAGTLRVWLESGNIDERVECALEPTDGHL
jgi:hypothetical protein